MRVGSRSRAKVGGTCGTAMTPAACGPDAWVAMSRRGSERAMRDSRLRALTKSQRCYEWPRTCAGVPNKPSSPIATYSSANRNRPRNSRSCGGRMKNPASRRAGECRADSQMGSSGRVAVAPRAFVTARPSVALRRQPTEEPGHIPSLPRELGSESAHGCRRAT